MEFIKFFKNKKKGTIHEWEQSGLMIGLSSEQKKELRKLFNEVLLLVDWKNEIIINNYPYSSMVLPCTRRVYNDVGKYFSVKTLVENLHFYIKQNFNRYDELKCVRTRYGRIYEFDNEAELCYEFSMNFCMCLYQSDLIMEFDFNFRLNDGDIII